MVEGRQGRKDERIEGREGRKPGKKTGSQE